MIRADHEGMPATREIIQAALAQNLIDEDREPVRPRLLDAPVILLQAATVQHFVSEVFKMYTPPHKSLIDDVHEDRLFDVWRKNPGVIPHATALGSPDADIQSFAAGLDPRFDLIDLRDAPIGMGFSWGRYGPKTEVKRFGPKPIFAYKRPEKTGLFSKLFGGS